MIRENPGSRIGPRNGRRLCPLVMSVVFGVAPLGTTGCQTAGPPAMSVEEAKQVAAGLPPAPFLPPPRTTNDITSILDVHKRADPEAVTRARARADLQPPKTTDARTLAQFYFERGLAARDIGRTNKEIEDLTKAADLARGASGMDEDQILWELVRAEFAGGSASRSLEYTRQAIPKIPWNQRGRSIKYHAVQVWLYARAGDLQAAEFAKIRTVALVDQSASWPNMRPEWIAGHKGMGAFAQGELAQAKGRFDEAEASYRRAIAAFASDPIMSNHRGLDSFHARLAVVLAVQGRYLKAENEARAALLRSLARYGRHSAFTAAMLRSLDRVILEQGRFAEAEALARAAVEMSEGTGATPDVWYLSNSRDELGAALVAQGRWREALEQYEVLQASMAGNQESYTRYLAGNPNWALALLRTGQPAAAREQLEVGLAKNRRLLGDEHPMTAETRGLLAMAYVATGDRARALEECRAATRILLNRTLDLDHEGTAQTLRDQRLRLILATCIGLLADLRETPLEQAVGGDAAAEAFRLAEAAWGRAVQRAVDAGAARAAAKDPALAALVRQAQDAKLQVGALHGTLANALSLPTDQQNPKAIEALRTQIAALREARLRLADQIERDFPAYAQLVNPAPATVDQARAALRPGEALIATYVAADRTYIWAIPYQGPLAFAVAPLGEKELVRIVTDLRRALDPGAGVLGDIPPFDLAQAHRLYAALLEPVKAGWERAESLLIVPHGPLGQVPFSLLVTQPTALSPEAGPLFANYRAVPWLARTHAVTVLPSVASLATLRALPSGDPTRRPFVGFGDPYFSQEQARRAAPAPAPIQVADLETRALPVSLRSAPQTRQFDSSQLALLPRLPDTAEEIRSIAQTLSADQTKEVFLGERANEHVVKASDLSRYRVLAFATHGLVPGDLDGLTQPALALSAPEVAKVEGDGLLTMEEILGLRLNADWVVLSACNTAAADGAGAEAVSGLGRAFFYAGTRALLVSHWPVETTSARALTTDLFRRQGAEPGLTRAQALRQTMTWLIDEGQFVDPRTNRVAFSYAHPIFWAPFTLVGDGG